MGSIVAGGPHHQVVHQADGRPVRRPADLQEDLVADLVRAGDLTEEEAARHPQRNILTRALGIEPALSVDTWELPALAGDRYLLCSDGLFNELDDDRIAELVADGPVSEVASRLVAEAVAAGGHDNVTVLVVEVVQGLERPTGARPPIGAARPE
ncbi:MAG: SpoIIE family protein phosphatase, partial [Acidimicrobiales bacterium]|nr:SpoIIE family protein phosphatase [Acidimicrobiales bacterium]